MPVVHLFVANISLAKKYKSDILKTLNQTQQTKMMRFTKEVDQLRSLISSYLKNQLSKSEEKINLFGKPYFEDAPYFNISHSGKIGRASCRERV